MDGTYCVPQKLILIFAVIFAMISIMPFIFNKSKGKSKFLVCMALFVLSASYILIPYISTLLYPTIIYGSPIDMCKQSCDMLRVGTYLDSFPLGQIAHKTAVPSNTFFTEGAILYETGKHDVAIHKYENAIRKIDENSIYNDDIDKCINDYYKAIVYWNLGFAYQANYDKGSALNAFKNAKICTENFRTNKALINNINDKKKIIDNITGENWNGVSWTYYNLGMLEKDFDDKERVLKEAFSLWISDDIAYHCLLITYKDQAKDIKNKNEKEIVIKKIEDLITNAEKVKAGTNCQTTKDKFKLFLDRANEELKEFR